jgi:hypothetical protein
MPAGTLTGVQVLIAPAYILFSGTFNQTGIDMTPSDYGGEMDPHGADERGNPLGSLVYTNAFPSNGGNNNTYQQVIQWHNFVGSNVYCFKICDPSVANSQVYCNNVFDRTGCSFVAPAPYKQGDFSVCDSDNMDPVGVYTGSNGIVSTYSQPPDGVPITSLPPVKTPNSSNCVTYTSSVLYAQETWSTLGGASTPTTGASIGTGTVTSKPTGTSSKSGSGNSGSPSSSKSSTSGAAMRGVSVPGSSLWAAGSGVFIAMGMTLVAGLMTVVVAL